MREILFRGKRTDNDEWAFGFFTKSPSGNVYITETVTGCASPKTVDPDTVGQFTGLTDKDGKKIFEGDIVNCYTLTGMNDYRRGVVHWNEMFCGWYGKESCSLLCGLGDIYEIIGNIHDNPELVEELP